MTQATIIPASEHVRAPWRNGGGTTVELAKDGGPDGFDWRLSIADILAAGTFSTFEGYRRIISTVEGAGMRLTVNGRSSGDLQQFVPFVFDGADQTECTLLDGPIRDFNLIYRGDRVTARLRWIRPEDETRLRSPAATLLVFNAGAEISVRLSNAGDSGSALSLGRFDLVRLDAADGPESEQVVDISGTPDAVFCVVEIDAPGGETPE